MARQRHWRNYGEAHQTCFITTTALDFNHVFLRHEMRSAMARCIAHTCLACGIKLHAFVVMTHHVHILATMPEDVSVVQFVQRLKRSSSRQLSPLLTAGELAGFDQQTGLNHRRFWQRSFRSVVVECAVVFEQKRTYIHENPVRAGLCRVASDYRWSSAAHAVAALETDGTVDCEALSSIFAS